MTFELDPDLQLHARLFLGTGAQRVLTIALFTLVLIGSAAGLASATLTSIPGRAAFAGALPLALALLVVGPARAIARLFELERIGLLDHMRLCGRRPVRMLTACLLGSAAPYVLLGAAVLSTRLRQTPDPWMAAFALFVLAMAIALALLAYGLLPAAVAPDAQFMTPLLLLVGLGIAFSLRTPAWVTNHVLAGAAPIASLGAVAVALPVSAWLACRRLRRPGSSAAYAGPMLRFGARLLPADGPPEFLRQLRVAMRSTGTIAALAVAPLTVLAVSALTLHPGALKEVALTALPYFVLFAGCAAISLTIRTEVASGAVDCVRMSTQRSVSVVLGWYFGLAIPLWTTLGVTVLTLAAVYAAPTNWSWWLAVLATVLPALALAEGMAHRRPGTYVCLPILLFLLGRTYAVAQDDNVVRAIQSDWYQTDLYREARRLHAQLPRTLEGRRAPENRALYERWAEEMSKAYQAANWRTTVRLGTMPGALFRRYPRYLAMPLRNELPRPLPLSDPFTLTGLAGVLALAVAAGRVRRADGPSLSGWSVVAGVLTVAAVVRAFPIIAFPRLFPVSLVALASLASAEAIVPTRPWRRVSVAAAAALIVGSVVARQGGFDWTWSVDCGVAAALCVSAGILIHERTWRTPLVSLALRGALAIALIRLTPLADDWHSTSTFWRVLASIPDWIAFDSPLVPTVPPAPQAADLLGLTAVVMIAGVMHARLRRAA
jgi:hypothetical protein